MVNAILRDVPLRWVDRMNAHDLRGLKELYASHAMHTSPTYAQKYPGTGGKMNRDGMMQWWASAFQEFPGLNYQNAQPLDDGRSRVLMLYDRYVGDTFTRKNVELFEIENGLIVRSHAFLG